jgi:RNA polymerase sigma-70 factor, ECF subfamily
MRAAAGHRAGRDRARLEQPRSPQPAVDAHRRDGTRRRRPWVTRFAVRDTNRVAMSAGNHDRALVARAREGDRGAFGLLVERHYSTLLSCCRRALRDAELARDAAQQAVLTEMLGLGRLRDDDRFGAWLIGIGLNARQSLLAPRGRPVASCDPPIDGGDAVGSAASQPDVQSLLEATEVARRVREAIGQLPAGQRQAVALFYLAGLSRDRRGARHRAGSREDPASQGASFVAATLGTPVEGVFRDAHACP